MNKEFEQIISKMYSTFSQKKIEQYGMGIDWLDTPEGEAFETLCCRVNDCLDDQGFLLDGKKKLFILPSDDQMNFDQVSSMLAKKLGMAVSELREAILTWMADAEAIDPEWKGTQEHVDLVFDWIDIECKKYQITVDL